MIALRNLIRAFTLIELLIVVAIIAILAAIAVPNFLEAQVRAKVARCKADMRTVATGLEVYSTDNNNAYPDVLIRLSRITTPIPYLTSMPRDVFAKPKATNPWARQQGWYRYGASPIDHASRFALCGYGPDTDIDCYSSDNPGGAADNEDTTDFQPGYDALKFYPGYSEALFGAGQTVNSAVLRYVIYDPTNGTVSDGDIFRLSDHQLN